MRENFLGSPDQWEARAERMAIMMFDGKVPEIEAEEFCNSNPSQYGKIIQKQGTQSDLFGTPESIAGSRGAL